MSRYNDYLGAYYIDPTKIVDPTLPTEPTVPADDSKKLTMVSQMKNQAVLI